MNHVEFDRCLKLWSLRIDGEGFETPTSWIQPVRRLDAPAILKLVKPTSDEQNGASLLSYYDGQGAVRLFEADQSVLLMERATGERSLVEMATSGQDCEAAAILADSVALLHANREIDAPCPLTPLEVQFSSLFNHESIHSLLRRCADVARELLASEGEKIPLHGDLHHDNVLDGGARGWLAVDPKGLLGEQTYEVANLLRNPSHHASVVHDKERMNRHAIFYARRLGFDAKRVLKFAFAHAGLSASWEIEDGEDPAFSLECAALLSSLADA